ncbi:hypothetical protein PC129_g12117 [Phytophthora cactorum]|uniref:MULE transposase domain-containing protein n=1 Tax=Phytophthora cactorum TaxID=29920 RepID=A0A329S4U4_9STRA|nr:hypothetical protein Pcac1_g7407 [Phytophthora cactorum]KAG2858237.1 hypothetical protein PC113_g9971 [Phytophthora cactorum]KAG2923129.1 hypothetical protein PC115_g9048 [Phytophthora cactorum]KAG2928652.1 hypothetical protein PC117_g14252 [Phytophthora cactorum]KAG3006850.1 hypothetical protein PC119_g14824 [Phytophthora cactorum]
MPQIETDTLLGDLKKFRVAKSDLTQCFVCMHPSPHSMRVQRLACACKACAKVTTTAVCPWRARVMTCQQTLLVTIEEAYAHATPARSARKPVLTHAMKTVVMDWAAQGLKPKRIWNALVQRFDLNDTSTSTLVTVQRFVHHHVAERLGGSDLRDTVRRKVQETFFTGQEEETAAFTFTRRTNVNGNAVVGNGSNADPFVIGVSAKKLLRRADRDPASFILHVDATYKLTQIGYPVIVVGISDRARRFHLLAVFIVSQQQREQRTEDLRLLMWPRWYSRKRAPWLPPVLHL